MTVVAYTISKEETLIQQKFILHQVCSIMKKMVTWLKAVGKTWVMKIWLVSC